MWSAFAAFAATTLVGPLQWQWPSALGWTLLIVTALLGALSHYALIKAFDHAEASAVQPYSYTMLVWVTVLGALVFGDFPDAWTILGAAVIVASSLYTGATTGARRRRAGRLLLPLDQVAGRDRSAGLALAVADFDSVVVDHDAVDEAVLRHDIDALAVGRDHADHLLDPIGRRQGAPEAPAVLSFDLVGEGDLAQAVHSPTGLAGSPAG